MADTLRVDWQSLRAARLKYRRLVIDAERGKANLHAAYKLGQFLDEALNGAFRVADERMPNALPAALEGTEESPDGY